MFDYKVRKMQAHESASEGTLADIDYRLAHRQSKQTAIPELLSIAMRRNPWMGRILFLFTRQVKAAENRWRRTGGPVQGALERTAVHGRIVKDRKGKAQFASRVAIYFSTVVGSPRRIHGRRMSELVTRPSLLLLPRRASKAPR